MKRTAKLLLSLGVCGWDLLASLALRLLDKKPEAKCVVLYYHAIPAAQRARFAGQMDCLLHHARPIPAEYERPLEPGKHYAAVTFDDGFISVIENAIPELLARGIPSTIFIPTGSLGGPPLWVKNGTAAKKETVVSEERLKQFARGPLIAIGSHTVSHPNLPGEHPAKIRAELEESKSTLERILGTSVPLLSFPHGAYTQSILDIARETGYRRVFTIEPTLAFGNSDRFVTGRVLADPSDWRIEFTLKLLGAYRWLPAASCLKQRLAPRHVTANTSPAYS